MPSPNALPAFRYPFLARARRLAASVMLPFFCLIAASATQAATIVVTTTSDELDATSADGTGVSLREAIRDANATPEDDTILLPAGTYRLTR
ncbi:MAG: hypothetical protein KDN20_22985, partial [Verrucomicrobiae bacterium]|nr:hypothetical protein [Verrucomicrobiae bacterium]